MRIVFMGTPDFAVPCLEALVEGGYDVVAVVTQPDKPAGRSQSVLKPPAVKEAAIGSASATFCSRKRSGRLSLQKRSGSEPDVIITAAYGRILPKSVLDIPKYGCINVHASLLPKYRSCYSGRSSMATAGRG